jgi:hypothetical protein
MSFKLFIYYCALCGGWAALAAWVAVYALGIHGIEDATVKTTITSGILGLFVATVIGALDSLLNSVGAQRLMRIAVCMIIGLLGGFIGGFFGETLHKASFPRFTGWIMVGLAIGVSIGVFDLIRAFHKSQSPRSAIRKIINGVIGGGLGGLLGGLLFGLCAQAADMRVLPLEPERAPLAVGLTILGTLIGLLIGLAQVFLKEAWLKVESGFKAGRELILSKEETTIGRGEGCDIGLFGDHGVEKLHARILQQGHRYLVADANTPGGTFLNDQRVDQAMPLRAGDVIRVGRSVIRFGERQKRRQEPTPAGVASRTRNVAAMPTVSADNPFADF